MVSALRAIAKRHGLSLGGVQHILKRDAPVFSADGELLAVVREPSGADRSYDPE